MRFNPRFMPPEDKGGSNGNVLSWLQDWCLLHCDESAGRSSGIKIETNPDDAGWTVTVDLRGTQLQYVALNDDWQKLEGEMKLDWIHFKVADAKFEARCGPRNLTATLDLFRAFATSQD